MLVVAGKRNAMGKGLAGETTAFCDVGFVTQSMYIQHGTAGPGSIFAVSLLVRLLGWLTRMREVACHGPIPR